MTFSAAKDQKAKITWSVRSRAQWISALLMVAAFGCAVVTYALYQSTVLSCAFIAVPFITVLANGVQSIVPNKKPSDNPPKEKQ